MKIKDIAKLRDRLNSVTEFEEISDNPIFMLRFDPWEDMIEVQTEKDNFYLTDEEAKKLRNFLNKLL